MSRAGLHAKMFLNCVHLQWWELVCVFSAFSVGYLKHKIVQTLGPSTEAET